MWTFETPAFLLLLTLLPPAVYFRHFYSGRGGVFPAAFAVWKGESFKSGRRMLKFLLFLSSSCFWLGIASVITALAGPVYVEREKLYLSRGADIMFVLDESLSMASMDFAPGNRFEASKEVIRGFVQAREHDPVGLVTFADQAALRIPPTLDYDGFSGRLEELELMDLGGGTAVGLGIAIAALHLKDSTATEKIIILITDGENNSGDILPSAAADIAARMGIRLHAVGIGTRGEVPIEYTDPETGKIISGRFMSGFDEKLLKDLAERTGGSYFYAPGTAAFSGVMSSIDSLESSEKRVRIKTSSRPGYRYLLLLGLVLVGIDFILRKAVFREVL